MEIKPFHPVPLSLEPQTDNWGEYAILSYKATAALSRLAGMMDVSAKADLFWLTWLLKESQCSNVIEGTVTTFDEVLGENAGIVIPVERQDDVREVINYRDALNEGRAYIDEGRPLNLSFIKALHALLLSGARGQNKMPGKWRPIQVHIGKQGALMDEAVYIPPEPVHIELLLENWALFIKRDDINPLIQAAIMHAQFEMIHPFCDGNGRMGRLLISLFLVEKKVLTKPCFYMSAYLQEHRDKYYSSLANISKKNDWKSWIEFFLEAIIERSNDNIKILQEMTELYEDSKNRFSEVTASASAIQILDYIFAKPIFTLPDMQRDDNINLTTQAVIKILNKLEKASLIHKIAQGRGRTPTIWEFTPLLKILR
ncbi:MAG: Fic family protein [Bilophila wadsworthia]